MPATHGRSEADARAKRFVERSVAIGFDSFSLVISRASYHNLAFFLARITTLMILCKIEAISERARGPEENAGQRWGELVAAKRAIVLGFEPGAFSACGHAT